MSDQVDEEVVQLPGPDPATLIIPESAPVGTLEDILAYRPKTSLLYIQELGKNFHIRTLNGDEVDRYRSSLMRGRGQNVTVEQRGMRAKLIVLALGNPDGSRMLTDKDTDKVQEWPAKVMERIFDRARKFNGLTEEDTDDEKGNS